MKTLKETVRVERLTTGYTGRNGSKVAVTGSLSASLHGESSPVCSVPTVRASRLFSAPCRGFFLRSMVRYS